MSEKNENFTMLPNSFFLYNRARLTKPVHMVVYLVMVRFYNESDGYAFPSVPTVGFEAGISERTTTDVIAELIALGLLERRRTQKEGFVNNVYVPIKPIENEAEFFARFGGAREETARRRKAAAQRNKRANAAQRRKAAQSEPDEPEPVEVVTPSPEPPKLVYSIELPKATGVVETKIVTGPIAVCQLNARASETPKIEPDDGVVPIVDDGKDPIDEVFSWL